MSAESMPAKGLMEVTIERLAANRAPGSNLYSGWLADLRHGITRSGESFAIKSAGPYLNGLSSRLQRSGAIRAAAIRAVNKDVTNGKNIALGASFARLARAAGGSTTERQIASLPLLDLEAASSVLDGLVGRCSKHSIPVDFRALSRTLINWGSGSTIRAREVRNQIVLDFYSAPAGDRG